MHPRLLDRIGLVACWREGLLALHVLVGNTRGYTKHPQLIRWPSADVLACYLHGLADEADRRGYNFDRTRVICAKRYQSIPLTVGQLRYEMKHLNDKLQKRAPELVVVGDVLDAHPIFHLVEGSVEPWEIIHEKSH
jgi:hypothetical protein